MKIKHIQFSNKLIDLVEEAMVKKGYPTFSSVVHQAIIFFYDKNVGVPIYIQKGESNPDIARKKAVAKSVAREEVEKIKKEEKLKEKQDLCKNLYKGKVEGDICVFTSYSIEESEDTIGRIPLSVINEDLFENNVFFPSKEKVFIKRPTIKKLWKKIN